jgi:ABC-type branched-subunit amino acid transport system substrate-binding protein
VSLPAKGAISQGVTDKEIVLGISTANNFSTTAAAAGLASRSDSTADAKKAQAILDYLNANGGIAGRKVTAVFHDIDSTGQFDVEAQAACEDWTNDHKVFAALAWLYDRDTLLSCLARANVPLLKSSFQLYDRTFASPYTGYLYTPSFLFGDRWGAWIDALARQGYFAPGTKVGLLRLDSPEHDRTADNVIKPALAGKGVKLTDEAEVAPFRDAGDAAGATAPAVNNVVLRFKNANIDRVLLMDIGGVLGWFFGTAAQAQNYHPKYGLNSLNRPEFLTANVPAQQLEGSIGAGWWPIEDEGVASAGTPAEATCAGIMQKAAQTVDYTALSYCERLFFLKAALDRAPVLNPAGLHDAVAGLGSSFSSPVTHTTSFQGGRPDGVAAMRDFAYDGPCGCFKYKGSLHPI